MFFIKSPPLSFERRQRVGKHGGWLTWGLDDEDLGPCHSLNIIFECERTYRERISPKPMHRDCSQHIKPRHYLLSDVQTLSFMNSACIINDNSNSALHIDRKSFWNP